MDLTALVFSTVILNPYFNNNLCQCDVYRQLYIYLNCVVTVVKTGC